MINKFDQENDNDVMEALTRKRLEDLKEAKENIECAQKKQKEVYDKKHAKPTAFVAGEKVLLKDCRRKKRAGGKLCPRFTGPYEIMKKLGSCTYRLRRVANPSRIIKKASGAHLKPYKDSKNNPAIRYRYK